MSLGQSIEIIPNFFNLTYITNDGMAFGIDFPFGIFLFSALSIVLTIFLFYYLYTIKNDVFILRFSISLIIAGALGNLTDRILLGEVVDFFDFTIGNFRWYIFNIADSCVTVGMVIMLFDSIFLEKKRAKIEF